MPIPRMTRGPANSFSNAEKVRTTAADTQLRAGQVAATGGTKTAAPALLTQWKQGTVEATARGLAHQELQPELDAFVAKAQKKTGRALDEDETYAVKSEFFDVNASRVASLTKKHLGSFDPAAAGQEAIVAKAVSDFAPHIAQYRDPFTPVAQNNAQARGREVVLWENNDAMVLIDLFVSVPKALVVPKQRLTFPTEAQPKTLDELGRVAAHVSDAFMASAGAKKPAGIWINAPQELTVKQLHVHVGPNLPEWSTVVKARGMEGARAVDLMRDPTTHAVMEPIFQSLSAALVKTLGPSK